MSIILEFPGLFPDIQAHCQLVAVVFRSIGEFYLFFVITTWSVFLNLRFRVIYGVIDIFSGSELPFHLLMTFQGHSQLFKVIPDIERLFTNFHMFPDLILCGYPQFCDAIPVFFRD